MPLDTADKIASIIAAAVGVVTLAAMVPWGKLWARWRRHDEYQRHTKEADRKAASDLWFIVTTPGPDRPVTLGCLLQLVLFAGAVLTAAVWWNDVTIQDAIAGHAVAMVLGIYAWFVSWMTSFAILVAAAAIRIRPAWGPARLTS